MENKSNKSMECVLDTLIMTAASDVVTEMFDEIDKSISDENIHFSEEHIKKMNKILYKKKVYKIKKRFILVAIIAMTAVIAMAISASADRLKFLEFFMNVSDVDTEFRTTPEEYDSEYYVDENIGEGVDNSKVSKYSIKLNYIPDGFILSDTTENESMSDLTYYCNDDYFYICKSIISDTVSIDTENAETGYIDINECKAFISIKSNVIMLTWTNNDVLYMVDGNVGKEKIIKIAENLE